MILLRLGALGLEGGMLFGCIMVIAWLGLRLNGIDSFHLVIALPAAVLITSTASFVSFPFSLLVGATAAASIDYWWPVRDVESSGRALISLVVAASLALIAFDWITHHTPVFLAGRSSLGNTLGILSFLGVCCFAVVDVRRADPHLRGGELSKAQLTSWGVKPTWSPAHKFLLALLCWIPVVVIPMTTTGVSSGTLLWIVMVGIIGARLVSVRPLWVLIAAGLTVGGTRAVVSYFASGGLALFAADALSLSLLTLLLARKRLDRTEWVSLDI